MKLNKIILGTAQLDKNYGVVRDKSNYDFAKILNLCRKEGITTIDTSNKYYSAHEKLKNDKEIQNLKIISKISFSKYDNVYINEKIIEKEIKNIFISLNLKKIYCLMLHDSKVLNTSHGNFLIRKIRELKDKNLIQKIGLSIYDTQELEKFYHYDFDIIQGPFNIFDQRIKKEGWLKKIKDQKKQFHARSIFLQGLLSQTKIEDIPFKFRKWNHYWSQWFDWHKKNNIKPTQSCISFVMNNYSLSNVVIGIDNFRQLKEIIHICKNNMIENNLLKQLANININEQNLINPRNWRNL